jgi:hypothetical protein
VCHALHAVTHCTATTGCLSLECSHAPHVVFSLRSLECMRRTCSIQPMLATVLDGLTCLSINMLSQRSCVANRVDLLAEQGLHEPALKALLANSAAGLIAVNACAVEAVVLLGAALAAHKRCDASKSGSRTCVAVLLLEAEPWQRRSSISRHRLRELNRRSSQAG